MERDAFLLVGAFLVAFLTLNWSELKLISAQIKDKFTAAKPPKNDENLHDPQE